MIAGLAAMLAPFGDRVEVIELDANMPVERDVDVVLYDTFARTEPQLGELRTLRANPRAGKVVVFSWSLHPELVDLAMDLGASGYLSKTSTADELVDAIERIDGGEIVISARPTRTLRNPELDWPGRGSELTSREAEVVALVTQGASNADIAALLHLSINTIKGTIRSAYRKIGASNRVEAVLWGVANGMSPDQHRIAIWENGVSR